MASIFLAPEQTRLVTICAHVDHGKTTLADNLIEANGIISERLAGTLRYLDSLEEEQRRGITMKASAIGLKHKVPGTKTTGDTDIIVHLLDSPGHSDFGTEVSSSLQCCDGTLLVVDAVEGMCARTHQVLREAHSHQLVPILVINKVDRLCTDLCLSPTEAYLRLRGLIESVNAASAAMLVSKNAANIDDESKNSDTHIADEEAVWSFDPLKGNVIFASALFGWGFSTPSLSRSLFRSKTLPIKPMVLKQYLFGDFKYKDGKILKWKSDNSGEPLFADYALRPLWEMYEGVAAAAVECGAGSELFADSGLATSSKKANGKEERIKATTFGMDQVLAAMQTGGTNVQKMPATAEEIQRILTHTGSSSEEHVLRSLLRRYRPLSDIVLDAVYEHVPAPTVAAKTVRPRALAFRADEKALANQDFLNIQKAVKACDTSADSPVVAHICKFMACGRAHIRDPDLDESESSLIMGLARVLSGTLKTGDEYYVMGPKHNFGKTPVKRSIRLYLLMGSEFVRVETVPAGHLCAVQNLEGVQLKTATLCSSPNGMPLRGFDRGIRPLVKVNVESVNPADTHALERGLVKLSLADGAVEVTATAKGERILACLGELHLEQSILDLKKLYCGKEIELRISDPIVEFGETTDWFDNEMDFEAFFNDPAPRLRQCIIPPYNEEEGLDHAKHGRIRAILSGRFAAIHLRAIPLTQNVSLALKERKVVEGCNEDLLQTGKALGFQKESMDAESVLKTILESLCSLDDRGNAMVESRSLSNGSSVRGVISDNREVYVPRENDNNLNEGDDENNGAEQGGLEDYNAVRQSIHKLGFGSDQAEEDVRPVDAAALHIWKNEMRGSAVAGFQMAVSAGPICEEPVHGVMVILEAVEVAVKAAESENHEYECTKRISGGMVVAALRFGIRCALL